MKNATLRSLLLLSGLGLCLLQADGDTGRPSAEFDESFAGGQALAFGSHRPVPFALDLARQIGETEFGALDPGEAAGIALGLAMDIDTDIRTGLTFQEAKARSMQQARLLMRNRIEGRNVGAEGLRKMRSRATSESGKARAGGLVDPLRNGSAPVNSGWTRLGKR